MGGLLQEALLRDARWGEGECAFGLKGGGPTFSQLHTFIPNNQNSIVRPFEIRTSYSPKHSKIWTKTSGFHLVCDKMAAYFLDFKFQIPFEIQTICNLI